MIKVKLGEIVTIANGSTPSTSKLENFDGNISWITPKDISDNKSKYIYYGGRNITELGLKEIGGKLLSKGTILFSSRAPIGLMSINKIESSTNQGFKNMICKEDKVFNEYLYYLLKTQINKIQELGTGTTFKEVSKTVIENFELYIEVDLHTQQKIASVLSALDDKIELNNKINAELEAMAKTLYDYWFVQFEFPNAKGKPYKTSGGKMVYSDVLKREIPEGWEVKKLGEALKTHLGGTPSTKVKEFWDGNIPWLNSGEVANFPLINTEQQISLEAIKNSSTNLLKKGSVLLSITRHLRVNILGIDACINQSIAGIEENDLLKKSYIYFAILNDIDRLMDLRTGAQQPHINKTIVDDSPFLIPSSELLEEYYKINESIIERIVINAKQKQELSSLRDWLLPMLMNGQVKVV